MKILLTGSRGMVGSNIAEHSIAREHVLLTPSSQELNLLNAESVLAYMKSNKPDMVIHAAGIVGGIQANIASPVKFLVNNMQMGLNIIMSSRTCGVRRFMNLGTSCMYPRDAKNPLIEEMISKGPLEPTNEGYAIAKVAITRLCEYINREDDSYQYKTVIPCNLYGKYDKFDPDQSHMIPAVIRKINEAKEKGMDSVDIWGDGLVKREFMYAGDFADFVCYAVNHFELMPQNINVGIGRDYTINEYYKKIAEIISYKGHFVHDLSKPIGMKQKLIDDTKLTKFGWKHEVSLELGLQKPYHYFLNEMKNE